MSGGLLDIILDVITPVAVCAAIGYAWSRAGQPFDKGMVGKLVLNIGVPCLVFATLVRVDIGMEALLTMGTASLASSAVFFAVGLVVLKVFSLSRRTYLNPIAFANTGNMGLPLCLLAFGEQGLALAIAYFAVNVVLAVTIGIAVASARFSLGAIVRQPFVYAAAAAVVFMATDLSVPEPLYKTASLLGDFSIPLMLITLGVSLAELKIDNVMRSLWISVLRLGIGLAAGFGLAFAFGMTGPERGVFVIMCAMPVAVIAYLLAETYGGDARAIAGSVIISTLMSFAMLPALLWALT